MVPVIVQAPSPGTITQQSPSTSFPNPVALGNLLVAEIDWQNVSGTATGVTDNLGNNWVPIASQQANLRSTFVFATIVTKPGNCTLTFVTTASNLYYWSIYEANGAGISLDGSPVYNTGATVTSFPTGTLTTSLPNSLVLAFIRATSPLSVPASPWISQANAAHGTAYQVGAAGAYSLTWTGPSGNFGTIILAFAAASAPPAGSPSLLQQKTTGNTGTTAGANNLTFDSVNTAQSLIVVKAWSNSGYVSTPTDSAGNIYQLGNRILNQFYCSLYYCLGSKGGANTVTVTVPGVGAIAIEEWSAGPYGQWTGLDGAVLTASGGAGAASVGPIVTTNPTDILSVVATDGAHHVTLGSGWQPNGLMNSGGVVYAIGEYQIVGAAGSYTGTAGTANGSWTMVMAAFKAVITLPVPPPTTGGTTPSDNFFTLLAKGNKALGGTGTTPSDNEFTLLAKQFRLLSGSGAQANTTVFILLARINKFLGGTGTTPSDNIFTLLAKQNRLLGGTGATASDTVFTLLAKNSKLLHH